MQNRNYVPKSIPSAAPKSAPKSSPTRAASQRDELTRIFNTALVSSQAGPKRDFSAELYELTEGAPFKAILNAVRQLACVQGVAERQAAEEMIRTFRKMDEIWGEYILREGLDRLRGPRSS